MVLGNDISKYQTVNFDIYKNNANFVILKASEGNGYTDPKFTQYQLEARRVGLPLGFYHFARPDLKNIPEAEAAWFLKVCGELKGGEFLCLDYEATWTGGVVDWCLKFLDYVNTITGVKCFVYLNQALIKKYDWKPVVDGDYPLWVAAYTFDPNNNTFVTGKWPNAAMQQWSNKQIVPGISGGVDGDVFFGTIKSLVKYGYVPPTPPEVPSTPPTVPQNSDSLDLEKKINELSGQVVTNSNQVNILSDFVSNVVRKIDDIQKDITTIYQDRDTLSVIQQKITENTNAINNVSVANTSSTTELKGEIRAGKELTDNALSELNKRIVALEKGNQIANGKFEFIKKLFGKYYLVKVK
jgi:GH25 family lysozyme M1 (1,4-beta-N-acetylmuramidase)